MGQKNLVDPRKILPIFITINGSGQLKFQLPTATLFVIENIIRKIQRHIKKKLFFKFNEKVNWDNLGLKIIMNRDKIIPAPKKFTLA